MLVVAHELFDALPVHQFQLTDRGWRERLVDVSSDCMCCQPADS
jgi:NADH dehydrogenase [ubiquinone] 1 alpha subcomplex assembly factor 7